MNRFLVTQQILCMLLLSPEVRSHLNCSRNPAIVTVLWKTAVCLNQTMQNLENADEVCYHWADVVDLDTLKYRHGLKHITDCLCLEQSN